MSLGNRLPFFGTTAQWERIQESHRYCIELLATSQSIRQMVLESWLTLDFVVREFLISGFELDRFSSESFDLKYLLLPKSFEDLIRLLEVTAKHQAQIEKQFDEIAIRLPGSFFQFLMQTDRPFCDRLGELESQYYQMHFPKEWSEYKARNSNLRLCLSSPRFKDGWIDVANNLDESWFLAARTLNKARNRAAHSHDPELIAKTFGISGQEMVSKIKSKCLALLENLLGTASN